MIDGITINFELLDFVSWKQLTGISFNGTTDMESGTIETKKRENKLTTTYFKKWETFTLTVKEIEDIETRQCKVYLTVGNGSLHKNHFEGANYLPFSYELLQKEINHVCKTLFIEPSQAQISTLEVGVNISTPFEVSPFLFQNIISYKGNPFNRYKQDAKGFCLGIYCQLSQYEIKIYDKGKQYDLPYNLMRFEKRFLKMQQLQPKDRPGIKYLSDLQDIEKVKGLLPLLLEAWQSVLIYDIEPKKRNKGKCYFVQSSLFSDNIPTINEFSDTIKKGDIELLRDGQNPRYWEKQSKVLPRSTFNKKRNRFKELVEKLGNNWHKVVNDLIVSEWGNLFKSCTLLPSGEPLNDGKSCTLLPSGENEKVDVFTIKIKGKNVHTLKNDVQKNRYCQTCGKDITHQRKGSRFCGEKYVGYDAAHKCRLGESNPRNNLKNKVKKINSKGVLFDILPFIVVTKNKKAI